jgi:hypothetical protein
MRAIASAAFSDGESIRDEEVPVAADAVGVGGRELGGGGGAMAIGDRDGASTREERRARPTEEGADRGQQI